MRATDSAPLLRTALRHLLTAAALLACASPARADSLWLAAGSPERALTSDRKASAVGDILTVVVQESASNQSTQRTSTDSASNVDAGVEQWLFAGSGFGKHKGELPGIKLGGSNDFSGGGSTSASQNLNARAAVLVTAVLPNGNLVIQGARQVSYDGDTQHVVLHGVVRREDVSAANIVFSSSIADARVEFINEGTLKDAKKKGWLTRLYEKLRPY